MESPMLWFQMFLYRFQQTQDWLHTEIIQSLNPCQ
jgi:hypothetical protein